MSEFKRLLKANLYNPVTPLFMNSFKFSLLFNTTYHCDYECAHCCVNAGPQRDAKYIPQKDVEFYLDDFKENEERFKGVVVFSGGEVTTAYEKLSPQYMPSIMQSALDRQIEVNIKTNGAWVDKKYGNQVFKDLEDLKYTYNPDFFPVEIHLSVDRYHPSSVNRSLKIIEKIAHSDKLRDKVSVALFTSPEDELMVYKEMLDEKKLDKYDLNLTDFTIHAPGLNVAYFDEIPVGITGFDSPTFQCGRAVKNKIGKELDETHKFEFAHMGDISVAFDSENNVELQTCGPAVSVPYLDKKSPFRNLKPWKQIKEELTQKVELEYEQFLEQENERER